MRIVFAGSPSVALPSLDVVARNASTLRVLSQPDRPVGRRAELQPTAVSRWALERGADLVRPRSGQEIYDAVASFQPDLAITVAYGQILSRDVLDLPRSGWWNVHFSLLPKWRGAAPVQHALLAGETTTGVTVFQLDEGVDTGPIIRQQSLEIPSFVSAGELLESLAGLGATVLHESLALLSSGRLQPQPQHGPVTLAPKLTRSDARISWNDSADAIVRRWQAVTPEPGAWCQGPGGMPLKILRLAPHHEPTSVDGRSGVLALDHGVVVCGAGSGSVALVDVLPSGKKAMSAVDWWRGQSAGVSLG